MSEHSLDECGAVSEAVKISEYGPAFHAICTLPEGHRYDHFDEAMNWQWENHA